MRTSDQATRDLGERVAQEVERLTAQSVDFAAGRSRLLKSGPIPERRRWPLVLGLAAALSLVVFVGIVGQRPRPMTFSVGTVSTGDLGSWIAAPPDQEVAIQFSDGSRIGLEPGARARVVHIDAHGAQVVLERGRVEAHVVHSASSRWRVSVGPYNVQVTGTRFQATWDPLGEQFSLRMLEGSVVVTGPGVRDRPVTNGEALVVQGPDRPPQFLDRSAATSVSEATPDTPLAISALPPVASAVPEQATVPEGGTTPPEPAWNELAASGRPKEAVAAAEREGYDKVIASASEEDLMLLGDAARFSGHAARSIQAYQAVRKRFAGGQRAAHAAFLMGKVNADLFRNPGLAARFFDTYLAEQPGGVFAREATGRLIEARRNTGDHVAARAAARKYLRRFPQGPHAALARQVLQEGGDDE